MHKIKQFTPTFLTLLNLFCGIIASIYAVLGEFEITGLFVAIGLVFDFLDGFIARLLNVQSELGKQMDSLADVVTFGVVPGLVMFHMLLQSMGLPPVNSFLLDPQNMTFTPFIGLLISLSSAYRLGKFNIDTRQSDMFIGLPTPACTLFVVSLPFILINNEYPLVNDLIENSTFLIVVTLFLTYLLNANLTLIALKFKTYNWRQNKIKFVFLSGVLVLISFFNFLGIPLVIVWYILVSLFFPSHQKNN